MDNSQLPSPYGTQLLVDLRGAEIVHTSSSEDPEVYLPNHEEMISHIALDIGGSLAKVVYFTRATSKPAAGPSKASEPLSIPSTPQRMRTPSPPGSPVKPNGTLGPRSLSQRYLPLPVVPTDNDASQLLPALKALSVSSRKSTSPYPPFQNKLRRAHSSTLPPGGKLNFIKFETTNLTDLIAFLRTLIESSARSNGVPLELMKNHVKIMATGGGAHKFYERLRGELGVEVRREEEMECLVLGLGFVMEVPGEVFWYSDELVQAISHPSEHPAPLISLPSPSSSVPISPILPPEAPELPRPSPNPPQYSLSFDLSPAPAQFPFLLVNIGSGVSIIKVDDYGKFERISGTSLGGGTLWGLLSLLTGARSFDDMLALADKGDNSTVDMLVGDIYGQDYHKIGLKSSTIASSFGKVFRPDGSPATTMDDQFDAGSPDPEAKQEEGRKGFKPEDISKSLLYAISNNIGQIAYMNAEKHNLDRIYFGGGFIRGHASTISTLSYAIRFWSKGTKKALFLRHEGYLGGIGAWLKNLEGEGGDTPRRT